MKAIKINTLLFFVGVSLLAISCKKDQTSNQPSNPVDTITKQPSAVAKQYRDSLGVGIDVDWAKTSAGMAAYSSQAVINFKARGIKHVRIRVANDMSASLLTHLERIVTDCINNNLTPVIAYQADAFKNNPSSISVLNAAINWWDSTATRFKNYSAKLSFDLLIECSDSLNNNNAKLNEYLEKATSAVRKTNPTRIIMISPRKLSNPDYLKELNIPTQHNNCLLAEWHFYAAGPSKTNANKLWTTGTTAEKKLITDQIDTAYAWQTRMGIPTWVGAWMPADYDGTDASGYTSSYTTSEQVTFATFMSCRLKAKGIPYSVNSDTKFYNRDSNKWYTEMASVVDAFLTPNCQ